MMKVFICVDKQDKIEVKQTGLNFTIAIGELEIGLNRKCLEYLEELIEAELWDECYHRKNLEEQLNERL